MTDDAIKNVKNICTISLIQNERAPLQDTFCHLYDARYKSKMHQYLGAVIPFYWLIGVRTNLRIWDQDNPTRSFQKVNFPSGGSSTFHYIQSWTELNLHLVVRRTRHQGVKLCYSTIEHLLYNQISFSTCQD